MTQFSRNVIIMTCFLLVSFLPTWGQSETPTEAEQIKISLLTCSPGNEIFTIFGHTAIRYENPQKGLDLVFNYGLFSFSTPNFLWRFVKGETDYRLGATDFAHFTVEYALEGRAIYQQTLNLSEEEKETLLELLRINLQPQNRVYRYNYFYDNCSTRARDRIEESINGSVEYAETSDNRSFRSIVHEAAKGYDWFRFGMDFCLGVKADMPITNREEEFAPLYLFRAFETATRTDASGNSMKLVEQTHTILSADEVEHSQPFFTPLRLFLLLFILVSAITIYGIKKRYSLWGVDLVLFAAAGLAGCVIAFLTFFSIHPAVSPNYLIAVFHPLHILLLPFFLYKQKKGQRSAFHVANFFVLTLFIVIWPLNPQYFDIAILPLALCLLIRSASNLILSYKKTR